MHLYIEMVALGGRLFFVADDGVHGTESPDPNVLQHSNALAGCATAVCS